MWANAKNERKKDSGWGGSLGGCAEGRAKWELQPVKQLSTSTGQNSRACGIRNAKSTFFAFPDFVHERK